MIKFVLIQQKQYLGLYYNYVVLPVTSGHDPLSILLCVETKTTFKRELINFRSINRMLLDVTTSTTSNTTATAITVIKNTTTTTTAAVIAN